MLFSSYFHLWRCCSCPSFLKLLWSDLVGFGRIVSLISLRDPPTMKDPGGAKADKSFMSEENGVIGSEFSISFSSVSVLKEWLNTVLEVDYWPQQNWLHCRNSYYRMQLCTIFGVSSRTLCNVFNRFTQKRFHFAERMRGCYSGRK